MRTAARTTQGAKAGRRGASSSNESKQKEVARSQPGLSPKKAAGTGNKLKKAMPADGEAALAVLQRVVESEEQLRGGDAVSVGDAEQIIAEAAKNSGAGQEQLAILSQLAGNTILHQQVDLIYQKSEIEKQAKDLRDRRLSGFCFDAQKLGYALADAYASEDGAQAQEVLLACLTELQEKMVQTEDTIAVLCGEERRDSSVRKQASRSTILCHMLAAVCSRNHLAGKKLFKQIGTTLSDEDAANVNDVLSESRVEAAYNEFLGDGEKGKKKSHLLELKEALAHVASQKTGLSIDEFACLKERLHIEVAQQRQLESHIKAIRERHVVSEFCSYVMEGDRARAYKLLHDTETVTSTFRRKLTQALTCTQWDTSVARLVEELARMVMRKSPAEERVIMPDETLSPFDVSLILELTKKYSPEIQFENELVVMLAKQLVTTTDSPETSYGRPEENQKASEEALPQSFSALSAVRYVVNGVLLCRKKNECVHTFLQTAKTNIAFNRM